MTRYPRRLKLTFPEMKQDRKFLIFIQPPHISGPPIPAISMIVMPESSFLQPDIKIIEIQLSAR
jgi:hypothetical protein